MKYSDLPWVAPIDNWLSGQGDAALTWIGVALAVVTLGIAFFGKPWLKLAWLAYMFAP